MTDNLENWFLGVVGKSASFEVFLGHVHVPEINSVETRRIVKGEAQKSPFS